MRRSILQNIKVKPYSAGDAIDRDRYLSAVLAIHCTTVTGNATAEIAVEHCDTETGTFETLDDPRAVLDNKIVKLAANELYNADIDLAGCRRYVKLKVTIAGTATCVYALALGDAAQYPVTLAYA